MPNQTRSQADTYTITPYPMYPNGFILRIDGDADRAWAFATLAEATAQVLRLGGSLDRIRMLPVVSEAPYPTNVEMPPTVNGMTRRDYEFITSVGVNPDGYVFNFLLEGTWRDIIPNVDYISQCSHRTQPRHMFVLWQRTASGRLQVVDYRQENDLMASARNAGRDCMVRFYSALLVARRKAISKALDGTDDYQQLFDYVFEDENKLAKMESELAKKRRKDYDAYKAGVEREIVKQMEMRDAAAAAAPPEFASERLNRIRRVRNNRQRERIL